MHGNQSMEGNWNFLIDSMYIIHAKPTRSRRKYYIKGAIPKAG